MSYQVLARKWRPRRFAELVGQEHVVRALTHALDTGRIHHAFLFTGTRGVGKTTIARIFAKSLNCERGVSADPCGECSTCRDVDAGRFMDLLEIDAASNTGVDDVREVIENAQYRPARGNYKVYLIDEVHMLSKNAFNALLKTLEEPPEHAKFLLATTDPQKLPVTVLSRCLQFNLKRLSEDQIAGQLEKIVGAEGIASEPPALRALARAGNGSLRDALSLLDQAIAFGGGSLRADDVRTMLGTIDRGQVAALLDAIVAGSGADLLARIDAAAEFVPDFGTVLDELAALLHRVQLAQLVPAAVEDGDDGERARAFVARVGAEDVQLLYQIAIIGRRDLALAPSPRAGFEMTLLRMLAFRPAGEALERKSAVAAPRVAGAHGGASVASVASVAPAVSGPGGGAASVGAGVARPAVESKPTAAEERRLLSQAEGLDPAGVRAAVAPFVLSAGNWLDLLSELGVRGPLKELAMNCVPLEVAGDRLRLGIRPTHEHFRTDTSTRQLADALAPRFGAGLRIQFEPLDGAVDTAADHQRARLGERQQQAEEAIAADPVVKTLIERFDARVLNGATRPVNPEK